jgi:AcrR family transcriptional regulator
MAASATKGEAGAMPQHIAQVAAKLFAARGYDATPVRAIVEAAGVTKPTLYYHFGSKEGLGQALFTVPMARLVAAWRAILEGPADPVAKLMAIAEAHFAFGREDPDRARFAFALYFGPLSSDLAAEMVRFADEMDGLWTEVARLLREHQIVAPDRAEAFATAFRGVIVISLMDFLYRQAGLGPDLAQRIVADLLEGFGTGREVRR